ncbi:hypothetical protein R2360_25365 [Mycobacteroides chelonae]|uniref:hypothetical protein n=1 Tax=Mycobacteroides chelonae TaxID=1774 RepID=UPI001E29E95C|nr:hypothetical protein [Mycobacteroides chelonae]MEC4842617.1 hypothetical protein [Mycobacteroides chelonae]MEC4847458.1 hypothetical protein [Mycobacteroides chelonae]WED90784.1 hypothetical protein PXJ67_18550 [Mycobacteroides chelonae]WED95725.1 hypothetical protein PYW02_17900 [Mycobacteroides chelonae]
MSAQIKIKHHPAPAVDPAKESVDVVTTVKLGPVAGAIVRSVFDGGNVAHEAHLNVTGGNSPSRIDDPQVLRNLGTVAIALADELAAVTA